MWKSQGISNQCSSNALKELGLYPDYGLLAQKKDEIKTSSHIRASTLPHENIYLLAEV